MTLGFSDDVFLAAAQKILDSGTSNEEAKAVFDSTLENPFVMKDMTLVKRLAFRVCLARHFLVSPALVHEVIDCLLARGIDLDAMALERGDSGTQRSLTLLHAAIRCASPALAGRLISLGADIGKRQVEEVVLPLKSRPKGRHVVRDMVDPELKAAVKRAKTIAGVDAGEDEGRVFASEDGPLWVAFVTGDRDGLGLLALHDDDRRLEFQAAIESARLRRSVAGLLATA